jgi:hypothetical protein
MSESRILNNLKQGHVRRLLSHSNFDTDGLIVKACGLWQPGWWALQLLAVSINAWRVFSMMHHPHSGFQSLRVQQTFTWAVVSVRAVALMQSGSS